MSPVPARSTTKLQTPAMVTFDAGGAGSLPMRRIGPNGWTASFVPSEES